MVRGRRRARGGPTRLASPRAVPFLDPRGLELVELAAAAPALGADFKGGPGGVMLLIVVASLPRQRETLIGAVTFFRVATPRDRAARHH